MIRNHVSFTKETLKKKGNKVNIPLGSKVRQILEGWKKHLKEDSKGLALERVKHCKICLYSRSKWYFSFLKGNEIAKKGQVCTLCHCPLTTKLRVLDESCPMGKW